MRVATTSTAVVVRSSDSQAPPLEVTWNRRTVIDVDLLSLYGRASEWTLTKVDGAATRLDSATPCEDWDVRGLMNHMLDTQQYFVGAARGQDVSPPSPNTNRTPGRRPGRRF
jgi:hypothetical protein